MFVAAALSLPAASRGRFEAGLGAGWAEDELADMGIDRVQFTELAPGTHAALAAHLL